MGFFNFFIRGAGIPSLEERGFHLPSFLYGKVRSLLDRRDPGEVIFVSPFPPEGGHRDEKTVIRLLVQEAKKADLAFGWVGQYLAVVVDGREPVYYPPTPLGVSGPYGPAPDPNASQAGEAFKFFSELKAGLELRKARLKFRALWKEVS